ncbi:protein FAM83H [Phycodurus eques]|uniref:protein FAM83H n=1 Tax=Phycodurus eques TaxID=693459 RepID=UPI002ACE3D7D|nr:protein FAM83H [Phycodurus eques]XP_061520525.1 protein FAM83H [Phycodurus eques]XP_061520526.1 protein FAM83H [Phycodurus eques]
MAHRSQSSSIGDNPLDPNYLAPHYKEDYRLAIDALIENDLSGYYDFLQGADVVSFLAQVEIEHIKSTTQEPAHTHSVPDLRYPEAGHNTEGSSDTYWPMQSDLAAPGLDLGWPLTQNSFIGPTEVTTLVNPSEPNMPSIKEQARRLIKNARQVIAVVMDTFTDVDIFADLLDATARHIPVYIILDEQEAHNFVSMVINCKVNLDLIQMMRVRTVAGITYQSRTGKSFKGQMKDRFLLADCRAVLSGNYSFMWSYEKIHRCIAHLFLGELVATFDEEFRILYAQSEPLVVDPSDGTLAIPDTGSYLTRQLGVKRTQSLRNALGIRRQPEITSSFPYGDLERNLALPFRRNDPFRHTIEYGAGLMIGKYTQQQFRPQQSYLEQGRSIVSRQMEISGFKRHSYAEGTQENYMASRHYMKHRVMNNLDETDFHREPRHHFDSEGPGPGSGHGHHDRHRPPPLAIDQYSDSSSFRSDLELNSGNYARGYAYLSSDDLSGPDGIHAPPVAGRYGGSSAQKRPTIGQAYACQSSPTQPHPSDKKPFPKHSDQEHDQDPSVRHGLRNWRIHSYLSTYEEGGEEGLNQPLGPDAFEDPPSNQEPRESSATRFRLKEPPNVAPMPRADIQKPRFGKPNVPDRTGKDSTTKDLTSSVSLHRSEKEVEKEREGEDKWGSAKEDSREKEVKEGHELFLSKHDSFRSRINPLLQRSSRLRSSLIFSSSKAEMHSGGAGLKSATEDDGKSSIVAQILEKRRSLSREPFEWKKMAEEQSKEKDEEKSEDAKEKEKQLTDITAGKDEYQKPQAQLESNPNVETSNTVTSSPLNINDPASRLQYFKDLAAKRKASKIETAVPPPAEKKPDYSDNSPQSTTASAAIGPTESDTKKPDPAAKLSELNWRSSLPSPKPSLLSPKPFVSSVKAPETHKEENSLDGQKKDIFKSLKPLASPKIFKRDPVKLKGINPRRVSCGEDIMTDATDSEKCELKKTRSHSSSTLPHDESKEKVMGSNTSINTLSEGKGDGKTLDFLKKQTQRLKGFLGPKDKEKKSSGEDRGSMTTVKEMVEDYTKKQTKDMGSPAADQTTANHRTSPGTSGSSRYQPSGSSVLFSSNLRDDTKVILEKISANSQKNRHERDEDGDREAKDDFSAKKNCLLRPQGVVQEREGLLKRIESLRKEKKVYSRFEMGNTLG